MSIASEIQQLQSNLSDSYTACQNKGATMPTDQNFDNLATCISTIQTGGGGSAVINPLTVTATTSSQTITASGGTDGYSPITVNAVTSSIDNNITAGNIKDGVTILGVTGNYTGTTPTLITKNITQNGTYNATDDNADGYSSVTVNVSGGGSDPIGILFQGEVDANGNYIMPYDLTYTGDVYLSGFKTLTYSSTSGGAFASYLYHQASQNQRLKCRKIVGKVYITDLEESTANYAFYSFLNGQNEVTEVHFNKLYKASGTSCFDYAFQGMKTNGLHIYFHAFNSTYASSSVSAMGTRMLSGTTGATLHFPSNLSGTITSNFGGTNTVRLFDLPATS